MVGAPQAHYDRRERVSPETSPIDPLTYWAEQASLHWSGQPALQPLYGEYDLNFHAQEADGSASVLKVMRVDCAPAEIDVQIVHPFCRNIIEKSRNPTSQQVLKKQRIQRPK